MSRTEYQEGILPDQKQPAEQRKESKWRIKKGEIMRDLLGISSNRRKVMRKRNMPRKYISKCEVPKISNQGENLKSSSQADNNEDSLGNLTEIPNQNSGLRRSSQENSWNHMEGLIPRMEDQGGLSRQSNQGDMVRRSQRTSIQVDKKRRASQGESIKRINQEDMLRRSSQGDILKRSNQRRRSSLEDVIRISNQEYMLRRSSQGDMLRISNLGYQMRRSSQGDMHMNMMTRRSSKGNKERRTINGVLIRQTSQGDMIRRIRQLNINRRPSQYEAAQKPGNADILKRSDKKFSVANAVAVIGVTKALLVGTIKWNETNSFDYSSYPQVFCPKINTIKILEMTFAL